MSKKSSQALLKLLQSIEPIPEKEWNWLEARLEQRKYAPGAQLFKLKSTDASIHYLQYGLVRYFYLTEDGRERNLAFAAEGHLTGCLPAFIGAYPCTFTVEALEPTYTLVIPPVAFQESDDRHACWGRLKLRLLEHVALRKEAREAAFLLDTAETRYRHFLSSFGHLVARIPQYHIASYLGITPVALSRIRKRINLG